jgi:hypothetical protein
MANAMHIQVLANDDKKYVLKLNPAAIKAKTIYRESVNKALSKLTDVQEYVAFNVNYYWKGIPIGWLVDYEKNYVTLPSFRIRPCLHIWHKQFSIITNYAVKAVLKEEPGILMEAGPRILWNGINTAKAGIEQGKFKPDAVRRTTRVAIGTTDKGKVVIGRYFKSTPNEIAADMLTYKCQEAMLADGGHSELFVHSNSKREFESLWYTYEIQHNRKIPAGLILYY